MLFQNFFEKKYFNRTKYWMVTFVITSDQKATVWEESNAVKTAFEYH